MITLSLLAALLVGPLDPPPDPVRYPWPFAPASSAHEISNHFCAPLMFDETRGYLHGGIDIRKPAGTPVLAVADGTVWIYRERHLDNLVLTEATGASWEYRHLWADHFSPEVRRAMERGLRVKAGTVIGEVAPWGIGYSHLHFNRRRGDGTIVDPLSELIALPDGNPPTIRSIDITPAHGTTPFLRDDKGAIVIAGSVDIVVDAFDGSTSDRWIHPPRRASVALLSPKGARTEIASWHPFDRSLPLPARLPVPRYPRGAGLEAYQRFGPIATSNTIPVPSPQRFSIVVTNGIVTKGIGASAAATGAWDTTTVADGKYTIEVEVHDAAGLHSKKTAAIVIQNASPPPQRSPESPSTLERSLGAHAYETCFAGDRVEHTFRVPNEWLEAELVASPRVEIIERSASEGGCLLTVRAETEGLLGSETFEIRRQQADLGGKGLTLEVEIHPLFEVAPRPRLRRDREGITFLHFRLRTPAEASCLEVTWQNGEEAGILRATRHGLGAQDLHCMTIEVVVPEASLGGTMQCTMTSLDRVGKVEIPIPKEVSTEAL